MSWLPQTQQRNKEVGFEFPLGYAEGFWYTDRACYMEEWGEGLPAVITFSGRPCQCIATGNLNPELHFSVGETLPVCWKPLVYPMRIQIPSSCGETLLVYQILNKC